MNYLLVISDIFKWLANLQIRQKETIAKIKDDKIYFTIDHPSAGKINIERSIPEETYFREQGIGFRKREIRYGEMILDVYDFGAIFDPIDSYVPGDHYATTHFALLGSILYKNEKSDVLLERIIDAIEFHLNTYLDEYYFGDWGYHWDFKNYAFLETFSRLKSVLDVQIVEKWKSGILNWKQNLANPLTNWLAMRSYANIMRHQMFGRISDWINHWYSIYRIERARHNDGCFDDYKNHSRPIQYHVFTLALLHRIYLLNKKAFLGKRFLSGVEYFARFIDPDGCFNYLGRGQEQNFGYAAGIYILQAAAMMDNLNKKYYQQKLEAVWNYFIGFKRTNYFPLVLNEREDSEKFGWYDYHHLTVYNAFVGVWLGLASEIIEGGKKGRFLKPAKVLENENQIYFKETKNIIYQNHNYFVAFSGGMPEYLSEPTLTPIHLWMMGVGWVFSCPGGPSPRKYGKVNYVEHIEKNLFAPIFQDFDGNWYIPAYKSCDKFSVGNNKLEMKFKFEFCTINRLINFNLNSIEIHDCFDFEKVDNILKIRYFNFPIAIDKFSYSIMENKKLILNYNGNKVKIQIQENDFGEKTMKEAEEIKTAKGLTRVIEMSENITNNLDFTRKEFRFTIEPMFNK